MAEARPGRIRLGPPDLLGDRTVVPVVAGRHHLVLVRDAGRIVAAERACPHEGADLSLGHCAGGRLRCPRHLASFDLHDGSVSPGWSFRALRLFPVEVEAGGLWLTLDGSLA
ncbi:Rieske (2Fe-2S) protein [Methylobacterium oryzihabitans]|uniref:Rieske (2Fe-2S) protein n=1 Tax=Methylobacterium oryzihabitans TaxID=2499852 RepID=A0A437NY55_9HYPH|nr:Rieske 2Fe-2S domain-containing protein [Methylobacterium oryzihabitans]RVU14965.1 Rieske (2Fe-2S) protein [Methylobacterium oryzihabitans]